MKKLFLRLCIALVVILILAALSIGMFLDGAVKSGIERVGPMLTKVPVKIDSVRLSLVSGGGQLKGLVVGNPEGYKSPSAIQVGNASLALKPTSVFSDKVIIRSINVQAPEITFETDLKGNNLSKILSNVKGNDSGGAVAPSGQKAAKKLQVDDFLITGGKIHVSLNALGTSQSGTVALPEIHLTALGQGPQGITAAELTQLILERLEKEAAQVAAGAIANLSKDPAALSKMFGTGSTGALDKVSKGLGGFLKK